MPKEENIIFLEKVCLPKDRSYEGLLTHLFGPERTITACAHLSYRDIQRNLTGIGDMRKQPKQEFRNEVEELVVKKIEKLFTDKLSERGAFDDWHNETCKEICQTADNHGVQEWVKWMKNGFTHGLAQKILNMTIKNMRVMERWDDKLDKFISNLHVPVDSRIMEAASKKLSVPIPRRNGGVGEYSNSSSNPWSRWGFEEYIAFQENVREAVEDLGQTPIEWELVAWNE